MHAHVNCRWLLVRVILWHPELCVARTCTSTNGSMDARAIWYIFPIFPYTDKSRTKYHQVWESLLQIVVTSLGRILILWYHGTCTICATSLYCPYYYKLSRRWIGRVRYTNICILLFCGNNWPTEVHVLGKEWLHRVILFVVRSAFYMNTCHNMLSIPDNKAHGANIGSTWGRQDPGRPHVGPMNLAIWDTCHVALSYDDMLRALRRLVLYS